MSKAVSGISGSVNGFGQFGTAKTDSLMTVADSFSTIMQKTTGQGEKKTDSMDLQLKDSKSTDVQESANVMKENSKAAEKVEKSSQNEKTQADEDTLSAAEAKVQETAEKVVEKVADALGISEEEVEQAMETLGLTVLNLLDNNQLAQLMLNLSGETDLLALTTNEELYAGMKDVIQMVQEELVSIQEMYGLTEEEMSACMDALKEKMPEQLLVETVEMREVQETVSEVVNEDTKDINVSGENTAENEVSTPAVEVQETVENVDANENAAEKNQGDLPDKGDSQNGNLFLQNLEQSQNAETVVNAAEPTFTETQAQDIMDQIMDYMKVQVKEDTTNLEMQLQPETLGTLNVRIAAKNGMLTAQFTAQNEAVKNMIEGQLVVLQQNLEEQGVKVQAVEVNVATQQFDRNLDQGRKNGEPSSEEAKKRGPRRINLNDLSALEEEEMEEADRVTADMMARNGNTVDYLA